MIYDTRLPANPWSIHRQRFDLEDSCTYITDTRLPALPSAKYIQMCWPLDFSRWTLKMVTWFQYANMSRLKDWINIACRWDTTMCIWLFTGLALWLCVQHPDCTLYIIGVLREIPRCLRGQVSCCGSAQTLNRHSLLSRCSIVGLTPRRHGTTLWRCPYALEPFHAITECHVHSEPVKGLETMLCWSVWCPHCLRYG